MLIQSPPLFSGDERQQLIQVRSYLYQVAEVLNQGLNNLTADNFREDTKLVIQGAANQGQEIAKSAQTLKAMIIKTADIINAEIDQINTTLETNYVAQSEFGEYKKQAQADIEANAEGITQTYNRVEQITGEFDEYVLKTEGYIKTGVVVADEDGTEAIGIEIGDLNAADGMKATFTSEKLTFWQNGVAAAWISNGQWSSKAIDIKEKITLGSWQIDQANGFTIRWAG